MVSACREACRSHAATAASLALSSGEKLAITSQLSWSGALYTYAITFKNEGADALHVTVAGVRYNNYAIDLYMEPGEDASFEFQTVDGPEEREAIVARVEMDSSYEAVAQALGKRTPDAARMAVSRALLRLAEEMNRAS